MLYQVNQVELGINQVLQLIELTYGEGKSLKIQCILRFVTPQFFGHENVTNQRIYCNLFYTV